MLNGQPAELLTAESERVFKQVREAKLRAEHDKLRAELEQRIKKARLAPEAAELAFYDFEHGWADLFYFSKFILGYQFHEKPHRESCDFLANDEVYNKLFLAPRGSYKTSQISQAQPTWDIVRDPNIRVLLDSVSLTNSRNNLQVIERHFEFNDKLRFLFGDHCGKKTKWNTEEFVSAKRTRNELKESTVTAAAQGKVQIGPHYEKIVADDEHDKDNYFKPELVDQVKKHIRLLCGLLDPGCYLTVGGHRWGYSDAYSMLMGETDNEEELRFARRFDGGRLVRSAVDEYGNYYFPAVIDQANLNKRRDELGIDLYNAQLMNEPIVAGTNATFDCRNFKVYKELPATLNQYLTIDPGGEKKGNDEWVFLLGGMDEKSEKYFEAVIKANLKLTEAAEVIYQFWMKGPEASLQDALRRARSKDKEAFGEKWKGTLLKIGYEVTGQQRAGLTSIRNYIWDKYGEALPFVELIHSSDSKTERITAMGPVYQMGKIWHSQQMSKPYGLEAQLLHFPKGKDDIADAAAMQFEVARAPKPVKVESNPVTADEQIAAAIARRFEQKGGQMRRQHPNLGSVY